MAAAMKRVLFLCTGNSCRSQMAEGWCRHLHSDRIEALSAGTEPQGLNPRAVEAMRESGVDISGHRSKHVSEFADTPPDLVITVCGEAHERCPVFPGAVRVIHVPFDDPPRLAEMATGHEEIMAPYRRVRDEIRALVEDLPTHLASRHADRPGIP